VRFLRAGVLRLTDVDHIPVESPALEDDVLDASPGALIRRLRSESIEEE
jgi:hypothetical protein